MSSPLLAEDAFDVGSGEVAVEGAAVRCLESPRPRPVARTGRGRSFRWQIREAVDLDKAASGPSASASSASMSRSDRPRTHAEITSASNGSDRTTPLPNSVEAKRSVVLRSFGRFRSSGPAVVLIVRSPYPLRWPSRSPSDREFQSRPSQVVTSSSRTCCNTSRAERRVTSSRTSAIDRPDPNNSWISARMPSVGDTRAGTGVGLLLELVAR